MLGAVGARHLALARDLALVEDGGRMSSPSSFDWLALVRVIFAAIQAVVSLLSGHPALQAG